MVSVRFYILRIVAGCLVMSSIYHTWMFYKKYVYQSNTSKSKCPDNYTYFEDVDIRNRSIAEDTDQLIPKVLYQTSKSRCMHPDFAQVLNVWRKPGILPGYSFFLYDDEAMDDFLFDKERWESTFPSLHLALKCIDEIYNPTIKADIWRVLVLWEYGGIYADIDVSPRSQRFDSHSINPDDDGLFFTESIGPFYLGQMFLIASPHHPLMYYAVHTAVRNLLNAPNIIRVDAAKTSGPRAIVNAMELFMNNATAGRGIHNGTHVGEGGRSIRVEYNVHSYVNTESIARPKKKRIYGVMNMTHFLTLMSRTDRRGTCYDIMNATKTQTGFKYEGMSVELLEIPPTPTTQVGM